MKYISQELKNKLVIAGFEQNVEMLSYLVSGYRLQGKLVREANEIFWSSVPKIEVVIPVVKTVVSSDTKSIMQRAWEIAKFGAKTYGGSVNSYFTESLKFAWLEVKFQG